MVVVARARGDFLDLQGLSRDPGLAGVHVDWGNRAFVAQLLGVVRDRLPQVQSRHHHPPTR
jgi:hypothetical protein